jgi:hypothetical protein
MENDEKLTLVQAHEKFAKSLNGKTWDLLGKAERTRDEDELMVLTASASLYHWLQIGTVVHAQRGEWLLAHVFAILEKPEPAMEHALRCKEITEKHQVELQDFDLFYADEAMARVLALRGEKQEARRYKDLATVKAGTIADPEDKAIVMGDLKAGPWFDVE